ncbi:hypothetical protein Pfo_012818 [Paulownia fortunei]|nr:hypothetical protein Pfo_012818 [Paulownia fortunei]
MPLVRVEVRNEYGLGAPEMYREANKEEPKEILEGVAVAGLVGVLRQLGDLADFAAEVFHGLQEEVMITTSRSHKLMARVQRIEAALSPLEKAVLAQRSHLHFAYTAGSNWHSPLRCEKNHFVYSDVPNFILDSYEDCRGPPRLHLLDRFDPGGPGSCLKRYSDPTFFKRASAASGEASTEKVSKDKKGHKIKKRRSCPWNGEVSRGASFSYQSARMQFTQLNVGGHTSPSQPMSTYDATRRSDLSEQSNLDLRNGSGYSKDDFRPSYSMQPEEQESRDFISSPVKRHDSDYLDYNFLEEKVTDPCDDIQINLTQEQGGCSSYFVTLDEKTAIGEPAVPDYDHDGMTQEGDHDRNLESFSQKLDLETLGDNAVNFGTVDNMDVQHCNQSLPTFESGDIHLDDFETETDHFMDALNTSEPESETDMDRTRKQDVDHYSKLEEKAAEDGLPELIKHNLECQISNSESNILTNSSLINGGCGHNPISMSPKSPSAACCSIGRVPAKDESNSVSPLDKALLSAQRAGDSLNPGNVQSLDSSGNGDINDSTNVESVSCTVSSNFRDDRSGMPIIGDTRSSPESQKPTPEISNVTSVTFWTNGGLLGLQPSKPPDGSVLNDLPKDCLSKKDGKISSSSQHVVLSDKDPKPDKTESFKDVEEGLNTDSSTCQEYEESGISFRKTIWKISPADLDIKLGKTSDLLYPNNANSTGASVTASGSFLPDNSEFQAARKHPETTRSSSRMVELSNRLLKTGSNKKLLHGGDENSRHASYHNANAFEQKNHQNFAYRTFSGQTKDLFRGLDTLNHSSQEELRNDTNSKDLVEPEFATTPDPPPLPPVQWRGMKTHLDDIEDRCQVIPKGSKYEFDLKHSSSTISQLPKPAPFDHDQILETTNEQKSKQFGSQKTNGRRDANQGKNIDENDFLHQIRTKSFSLRPTVPAKPTVPSGVSSNVQVTAILEKANAIRQAVGSDDGDDDGNWSDT